MIKIGKPEIFLKKDKAILQAKVFIPKKAAIKYKNNKPFFSIIITAYNIEKYINECIESIKAQSFRDFECIIVDDGSIDNTVDVIKKSINDDERFRLIEISHSGPNEARNAGLMEIVGDYVLFPDGDDTLCSDCLKDCYSKIDNQDLLIFGINYHEYNNETIISETISKLKEMSFSSGNELADWYIVNRKLLLYSVANKCYRNEVLKKSKILFRKDTTFGEDRIFNYDFLQVCGKIDVLPKAYYNYRRINPTSTTKIFRQHYIDTILRLHEMKMCCMLSISKNTSDDEKTAFKKYDILKTISDAFLHLIEHKNDISEKQYNDELDYLTSIRLPDYFYFDSKYNSKNLIEYINSIVFPENEELDISKIDNVVVLGSTTCKYRVENAYKIFGDNVRYICCGKNVSAYKDSSGKTLSEAEYMCDYLKSKGVSNIIIENESRCTNENLINASSFIKSVDRTIVVTGTFHKRRVVQLLKNNSLKWKVVPVYGPNTKPDNWFMNTVGLYAIFDEYKDLCQFE